MTPEPYPGYFESQTGTGYDVKIYGAQMTQGEGISQHAESPSLPATWGTVRLLSIVSGRRKLILRCSTRMGLRL